ncbi:hypothetical protein [Parasutterella excrementihominis]|uniref:hypothetical protein n=1 Tax=Parasutterella excrementihominis TaxID=487175 RepID=UPI003569A8D4
MIKFRKIKVGLITSLLFLSCSFAYANFSAEATQEHFQKTWQNISKVSQEVNKVAGEREKTALETITFRQPKYLRLVDKAQDILGDSAITSRVNKAKRLLTKNEEVRKEIEMLEIEIQASPTESSWNPLTKTKESIEKKILSLNEDILKNENKISSLKNEILDIFQKQGVEITPEQLEYFLISTEGSDLVKLLSFAENMKQIQSSMEAQLKGHPDNLALGRYYAGMYLVSLEAYSHAIEEVIKNFGVYAEKLIVIKNEARKNLAESRNMSVSEEERKILKENDMINNRTVEVVDLYRKLLNKRIQNLRNQKRAIDKKVAVAQNTYNTLKNSGSLIALIKTADKDFSMILGFSMPELKTIYSQGLMKEFTEISGRLRGK